MFCFHTRYAPEIAPLEARAAIAGVSTATSWMANFVVLLVTPVGFDNIQYRYWIVYAVINAAIGMLFSNTGYDIC